jgi:hypothetical protein
MSVTLPLILDGLILVLLGGTIFFAARLSVHLKTFRSNRAQLEKLVKELAEQIAQADRAVAGMREAAREGGRDLQQRINEARALSEELQFMNETGNNLAGRLEKVATGSAARNGLSPYDGDYDAPPARDEKPQRGGFAIQDREYGLEDDDDAAGFVIEDEDDGGNLGSRAERELFEALQSGGRGKAGRS